MRRKSRTRHHHIHPPKATDILKGIPIYNQNSPQYFRAIFVKALNYLEHPKSQIVLII